MLETEKLNNDTVIVNGQVIDTHQKINQVCSVYICDGRIASIGSPPEGHKHDRFSMLDAAGCVVVPGLVDCHVHAYQHATPLGIDVDQTCLSKGVTTVVDAGSAGSSTFPGLRKFIAEKSKTRLFCFLHIAQHGLASAGCVTSGTGGECDSLNVVNVEDCVRAIEENRDLIVGVKVRLAAAVNNNGENEAEVYRRALEAARKCDVPLMTHHALSTIKHSGELGCPGILRPGDIYTHCFHCFDSILDEVTRTRVDPVCWQAKKRGVLFDVGHGQGSFSWRVAEICASEGFWPDIISTDLHQDSVQGPAYDLLCVMTKMLHIGMPLDALIAAVTSTPAAAIGKLEEIGQIRVGVAADITVLRVEEVKIELEDCWGEVRTIRRMFTPVAVFRDGIRHPVDAERTWPNPQSVADCQARTSASKKAQ